MGTENEYQTVKNHILTSPPSVDATPHLFNFIFSGLSWIKKKTIHMRTKLNEMPHEITIKTENEMYL